MYIPKDFTLQWHITDACNLRCKHCYQTTYDKDKECSFEKLLEYFIQYKDLIDFFNQNSEDTIFPSLTITGGEPFVHDYFWEFMEVLSCHKAYLPVTILTNGTLITPDYANKLKDLGIQKVQVSIDGDEQCHDKIRGEGNFAKAIRGLKCLINAGMLTSISFTAHKDNYKMFPKVADVAKDIGASFVWSDRMIPEGSGENLLGMDSKDVQDYIKMLNEQHQRLKNIPECKTSVHNYRALQFLGRADKIGTYACGAGKRLLTLMPNGDVYPCRRMPIPVGNLNEQSMKEIYYNNEILNDLRDFSYPDECKNCEYKEHCQGGLKCLAYAEYNSYKKAESGCWLKETNTTNS